MTQAESEVRTLFPFSDLASRTIAPSHVSRDDNGAMIYELWMIGRIQGVAGGGLVHIPARQRTAPHAHSISEHFSCVVRGRALLYVEGQMIPLGPGDCYTVPAMQIHELAASGTEEAWVFEGTAPLLPTAEQAAADFAGTRLDDITARRAEIDAAFEAAFGAEARGR
ncbi:MAG TPA: cupin domain-containing protein [Trebonia sp.]|jgi:quercetin dioxygenase-like cupin family protein|nr:cupin domain-containing protein [Trebonia sp.]